MAVDDLVDQAKPIEVAPDQLTVEQAIITTTYFNGRPDMSPAEVAKAYRATQSLEPSCFSRDEYAAVREALKALAAEGRPVHRS